MTLSHLIRDLPQLILISIRLGFSMSSFILAEKRATVAPSSILWSADMLMLIYSDDVNLWCTYCVCRDEFVAILFGGVLHILRDLAGFADGHDGDLRAQDGWHKVGTANVSHTGNAEGGTLEVCGSQLALVGPLSHADDLLINLEDALILDTLNVGDSESILGIDCDRKVLILLNNVLLDITVLICFGVEVRIHDRVLSHRN